LQEAAAKDRVVLMEHSTAIKRASAAAQRLDTFMSSMRGTGVLKEFTRAYKRRRLAAAESEQGFMSYKIAEQRLRSAMVPILMAGGQPAAGQSLFQEIFRS
jgi:hypothetical protein